MGQIKVDLHRLSPIWAIHRIHPWPVWLGDEDCSCSVRMFLPSWLGAKNMSSIDISFPGVHLLSCLLMFVRPIKK